MKNFLVNCCKALKEYELTLFSLIVLTLKFIKMNATQQSEIFEDVISDELLFNVDLRKNRVTVEFNGKHIMYEPNQPITTGEYYEYKKKTVKELTGQDYK